MDGVLNPGHGGPDWVWDIQENSEEGYPLKLSTALGREILALGSVRWLTTWNLENRANSEIAPLLGWGPKPVLAEPVFVGRDRFSWKPKAVEALISQPGPPIIWIDDEIDCRLPPWGLANNDPHKRLFPICPTATIGLTRHQIQNARDWLEARKSEGL